MPEPLLEHLERLRRGDGAQTETGGAKRRLTIPEQILATWVGIHETTILADQDHAGRALRQRAELPFGLGHCLLASPTLADVADYRAASGSSHVVPRQRRLQTGPEGTGGGPQHAQLGDLRLAGPEQLLAMQVVDILVLVEEETGYGLVHQSAPGHSQQVGDRQVGLLDQAGLGDRAVPDRGEVVEIEIALPRGVQFRLDGAQLLVLHLQLDLVHPQLVELALDLLRSQGTKARRDRGIPLRGPRPRRIGAVRRHSSGAGGCSA